MPETKIPQAPAAPRATTGHLFEVTSLTLLSLVRDGDAQALNELCARYWKPLVVWLQVSRLAPNEEDAQDHVQTFFARMIEKDRIADHDPARGKFRTYLITSLKRQVIDELRRRKLTLDPDGIPENAEALADRAFEKAWAWEIFEAAKAKLRADWESKEEGALFAALEPHLDGEPGEVTLQEIGRRMGRTAEWTRQRLFRLRPQVRETLRTILKTELPEQVTPKELDAELSHLSACLNL